MQTLKYKIIKSRAQYKDYCSKLEALIDTKTKNKEIKEEIELLNFLIEKFDQEHSPFNELDPVQLIHALMEENELKAKDLVDILNVSKGMVSDILNYKKSISKDIIRKLSSRFKISQEAFNRNYKLNTEHKVSQRNLSLVNEPKEKYSGKRKIKKLE